MEKKKRKKSKMKFSEWFEKHIQTGGIPYEVELDFDPSRYDVIINVSDEISFSFRKRLEKDGIWNQQMYWFPMNERKKDAGLNSLYGAMCVLFCCESNNLKVYLHCHAGANRSVAVKCAYHYLRTGKHLELEKGGFMNRLLAMCGRGYLPPKTELEKFLSDLGFCLNEGIMTGGTLERLKIEHIVNF